MNCYLLLSQYLQNHLSNLGHFTTHFFIYIWEDDFTPGDSDFDLFSASVFKRQTPDITICFDLKIYTRG